MLNAGAASERYFVTLVRVWIMCAFARAPWEEQTCHLSLFLFILIMQVPV